MNDMISNFYGTDIYIDFENKHIIAKHIFENKKETVIFDISSNSIIKGYFSDEERYEDVKEWIENNKIELLKMCENKYSYEIRGLD